MSRFWIAVFTLVIGSSIVVAQVVESPTTVPRRAWLLESDLGFANWDRGGHRGGTLETTELGVASVFLSVGLTADFDVQFGFDGWIQSEESSTDVKTKTAGRGDFRIRAKWNFVGDEEVGSAWAVLPYLKLPTADAEVGNGETEPGVALVYGRPINDDIWVEAMLLFDSLHNETSGREESLFGGIVLGHNVNSTSTVYAEFLVDWNRDSSGDIPLAFGVGISPEIMPGCALDFETLIGVTEDATDLGLAIRIVWEL